MEGNRNRAGGVSEQRHPSVDEHRAQRCRETATSLVLERMNDTANRAVVVRSCAADVERVGLASAALAAEIEFVASTPRQVFVAALRAERRA